MDPAQRISKHFDYHTVYIDKVAYRDRLYFVVTHHEENNQDVYRCWNVLLVGETITADQLSGPMRYERPKK